jgi:hypothetical protein
LFAEELKQEVKISEVGEEVRKKEDGKKGCEM